MEGKLDNEKNEDGRVLDIVSLYPKDMNIYGDTGNVKTMELQIGRAHV